MLEYLRRFTVGFMFSPYIGACSPALGLELVLRCSLGKLLMEAILEPLLQENRKRTIR